MNLKSKITAIKAVRNPRVQRANVFLDGKFAFSLDNEIIAKEKLKPGLELSSSEIDLLTRTDGFQRCLNSAFHFLGARPRSEAETRERLIKHGYNEEEIERTIGQLRRLQLLDDAAFAEYWKDNRNKFRPRSQRLLEMELKHKGVDSEVIKEAVEDIDESDNAYRAAVSKARTLPTADYQVFRRKLGGYLQRRGFNYGVINRTVKQVWQEQTGEPAVPEDTSGEGLP